MIAINKFNYEAIVSKGDFFPFAFAFYDNENNPLNIQEKVILGIKDIETNEILLEITGVNENQNQVRFELTWEQLNKANIKVGEYLYDIFLTESKYTPFFESKFIVKEVSHNV